MKEHNGSRQMVYTEYKKPKSNIVPLEERKRQKQSLKSYTIDGGDDAS